MQLDSLVIFKFEDEFQRFLDQNQIIKKQLFKIHSVINPGIQSSYDKFIDKLSTVQLHKLIKLLFFSQFSPSVFQQYLATNYQVQEENEYLHQLNSEQNFQLNLYRNIFYFADFQKLKNDIESGGQKYEILTDFIQQIVDYKQFMQIESYMFYFFVGLLDDNKMTNVLDELLLSDFNNLEIEMEKFQEEVKTFINKNDNNGLIGLVNSMLDLIEFDLIELDPENDIDVSKSIVYETLQTKFRIMNFKSKQKQQKIERQVSLFDDDIYEQKDSNYHQQLRFSVAANSMLINSKQTKKKNNVFKSSAMQLEESCLLNLKQSQQNSFIQQEISFGEKEQSQEYSLNINSIGYNNQSIEYQQLQNSIQLTRKSLQEKQNEYSRYICNKTAFLSNKYDKYSMGDKIVRSEQMGIECEKYDYYCMNTAFKENNKRLKQFQCQVINWNQPLPNEEQMVEEFVVNSSNNDIKVANRKGNDTIGETDYLYPKENDEDQLTKIIKKEMQRLEDKFGDQVESIIKQGLKSIAKKVKQEFELDPQQNYFTMMYQQLNNNKQSEFPIVELFEEGLLVIEEYGDHRYFLETFNCDLQQSTSEIRNKQYCQYQKVKIE